MKRISYHLLALACAGALTVASLGAAAVHAQSYSYPDKLYGGTRVLTPKPDEVMIRFDKGAGKSAAPEAVAAGYGLVPAVSEQAHAEALAQYRLGVYRVSGGAGTLARIEAEPGVAEVLPAMLDEQGTPVYFLPDAFVILFQESLSEQAARAALTALGLEIARDHAMAGLYTVRVPEGRDLFQAMWDAAARPDVAAVEPSFIILDAIQFVPNDPQYGQAWHLNNTGTNATGAVAGADVDAEDAWDLEQGDARIVVGVCDTGVDWDHPDLVANIHRNPGEDTDADGVIVSDGMGGWQLDPDDLNGIDDDGNGYVDDLIGYDFWSQDDGDPVNPDPDPTGTNAHGTGSAGLIAAQANNALGVTGLAPGVRLMPLRCGGTSIPNVDVIEAFNYVQDYMATSTQYEGAVINNSFGGGTSPLLQSTIAAARTAGIVPVFSAGNYNQTTVAPPANYPETIGVAATSPCDTRKRSSSNPALLNPGVSPDPLGTSCDGQDWWGSNHGDDLSIGAPGAFLPSTDIAGAAGYDPGDYVMFGGTSGAAPIISAAAALVMSARLDVAPAGPMFTPDEVQQILEATADKINDVKNGGTYDYEYDPARPGFSFDVGAGRVNVRRALETVLLDQVLEDLTAPPIDLALSIDRSGSMEFIGGSFAPEKFDYAKNAASHIVQQMNVGDRIAVTSYSSSHHPSGTASTDLSIREITLGGSEQSDALMAIGGLTALGNTAIGSGLKEAQDQLTSIIAPQDRVLILLTDGHSNTPDWVKPTVDGGYLSGTTAYTIGFGDMRADVNEDTLSYIADITGGEYFFAHVGSSLPSAASKSGDVAAVSNLSSGLTIIKAYQNAYQQAAQKVALKLVERAIFSQYAEPVHVDPATAAVHFSLLWQEPETDFEFFLEDPDGNIIRPEDADGSKITYIAGPTLREYRVVLPKPGTWVMRANPLKGEGVAHFSVWAYSLWKLVLELIPREIPGPIPVEAKFLHNGQLVPVRGVVTLLVYPSFPETVVQPFMIRLVDDGQNGDEREGDGLFGGLIPADDFMPGSLVVEAFGEGQDPDGNLITRYAMGSTFIEEDGPEKVGAENKTTPPGQSDVMGIHVRTHVSSVDGAMGFEGEVSYDDEVIEPTGEIEPGPLFGPEAQCFYEAEGKNRFFIRCEDSNPIQGTGLLAKVGYRVLPTAPYGAVSPFAFTSFRFESQQAIPVETEDGSVKVDVQESAASFDACLPGDPNKDVKVSPVDATLDLRFIVGLDPDIPACSNVDGSKPSGENKGVTPADASLKLQYTVGLIPCFSTIPGCDEAGKATQTSTAEFGEVELTPTGTAGEYTLALPLLSGETVGFAFTLTFDPDLVSVLDVSTALPETWLALDHTAGGALRVAAAGVEPVRPGTLVTATLRLAPGGAASLDAAVEAAFQQPQTVATEAEVPAHYTLEQNYPNPFNPRTTIRFALPQAGDVHLAVFDLLGREVQVLVDEQLAAGVHEVAFEAKDLPSGVYFYRLRAAGQEMTRRMVILK